MLMKLLILFFLTCFSFAQSNKIHNISIDENLNKSFKIYYATKDSIKNNNAAIYINNKHYKENCLEYISADSIASVNVIKGNFEFDDNLYNGKILVTTKNNYQPKFSSIKNIKENYFEQIHTNYIVFIDNKIINEDYNNILIDENYIFNIVIEDFYDKKTPLTFIKILTKNKENLQKKIIIR